MPQDYVLNMSDLQAARARSDNRLLREMFETAYKILETGGRVRVEEELTDTTLETIKFIASVAELKEFESHIFPGPG